MAGLMKINTDQVARIATEVENLNVQLKEELEKSQLLIENLSNVWSGEAYNATREAYKEFATKYFQTYYDIIDQYVKFLRLNVEQGYFETETNVINLAQYFK